MKNFTRKFIGLLALVFTMSFTANAQDYSGMTTIELTDLCSSGDYMACMSLEDICMQGDTEACISLCSAGSYGYYELGSCGCGTSYSFNTYSPDGQVGACDGSTNAGIASSSNGSSFNYGSLTEIYFLVPAGGNSTYNLTASNAESGKVIFGSRTGNTVNIYYTGETPIIETIVQSGNGHVVNLILSGCTDEMYTEYNVYASTDNGSCTTL